MKFKQWMMALCGVLALAVNTSHAMAQDAQGAYETVKGTTDKVLALVQEAKGYYSQDPERYYQQVDSMLSGVSDFKGFARSVMGRHASKAAMDGLDAAGKQKLQSQIDRFTESFRVGLVHTYAEGLLKFSGQRIEVQPPRGGDEGEGSVEVAQLIYGDAPKPYTVLYKMRKDKDGAWKLRNVTIEGINMGKVYRSQFDEAMQKYKGDIDQVIANWSVKAVNTDSAKDAG